MNIYVNIYFYSIYTHNTWNQQAQNRCDVFSTKTLKFPANENKKYSKHNSKKTQAEKCGSQKTVRNSQNRHHTTKKPCDRLAIYHY